MKTHHATQYAFTLRGFDASFPTPNEATMHRRAGQEHKHTTLNPDLQLGASTCEYTNFVDTFDMKAANWEATQQAEP